MMTSFSRIAAAFTVIALFALIISGVIMVTQSVGTQITHGNMVEHKHGTIMSKSETNNSLTLKTDSGAIMQFACQKRCLTQLGHMQRHINEHAGTDVYYIEENNTLIAVDVD